MSDTHDDLDAIRTIVDALSPFEPEEQRRIIRWAFEKLGLSSEVHSPSIPAAVPPSAEPTNSGRTPAPAPNHDIKSFVEEKAPANDMQFATTVAYFYAFEASEEDKKREVRPEDLQEACRLIGNRKRLANPGQTLRNAAYNGLLDKGSESGTYKINTVGENLVALTLPAGTSTRNATSGRTQAKRNAKAKKERKAKKKAPKKSAKKAKKRTS